MVVHFSSSHWLKTNYLMAPRSKSSMQRACAATILHKGITTIELPGNCNDDQAALGIIKNLGLTITTTKKSIEIENRGVFNLENSEFNCHESGLSLRMFTIILCCLSESITIKGEGSLLKRPMQFFDDFLPFLNKKIKTQGGFLPFKLEGKLQLDNIEIDGSLSSQYLTGLLMLWALKQNTDYTIKVNNLNSKPYIDLTLKILEEFGYDMENNNYQFFKFKKLNKNYYKKNIVFTVESDWSNISFLAVLSALWKPFNLHGLSFDSVQADKAILYCLIQAGCTLTSDESTLLKVSAAHGLNGFEFDATDCPDLFPPLVVLASKAKGTSTIKGALRLLHKESNRGITLQTEFAKIGVNIELQDDIMIITPPKVFQITHDIVFDSHKRSSYCNGFSNYRHSARY